MKVSHVSGISAFRFRLPLRGVIRVARNRSLDNREGVLLRLESDDGLAGWGEASPLPGFSSETLDDVVAGVQDLLSWISARPPASRSVRAVEEHVSNSLGTTLPSLDFAVGGALNALAASRGAAPGALHVAERWHPVPVVRLVQGTTDEEVLKMVRDSVSRGYRCLKLKVGRGPIEDEATLVNTVLDEAGAEVRIRIDANRAWELAEALQFCSSVERDSIEFIEEPLASPDEIPALSELAAVPIAIDESVRDYAHLIDRKIVAAAVIKPTVVGMTQTRLLTARCREAGIPSVLSCAYESGVGTFCVAVLSASSSEMPPAAGLGTHSYLIGDVFSHAVDFERPLLHVDTLWRAASKVDVSRLEEILP